MNCWLHRISYHSEVAYPLLENGYLSIGFSDFSELDFINDICSENGWQKFEKYFDDTWGNRPRTRTNLWRFVAEMDMGDWIVVPSWGTFSVYELTEEMAQPISEIVFSEIKDWHGNKIIKKDDGLLYRDTGELIDLGFVRRVKPIKKEISRYEYADATLTSRMKIRSTNACITDLEESIEKAIVAFDKGQPLNIYSQIISKTRHQILDTIKTELTPDKFEILVKWYFQRIGASEVYIPSKNESGKEGDADVVAVFEQIKTIIYSQVKFHAGETSSWAIEQIKNYKEQKDTMDDGYSKISWVISSADNFSKESYDFAKEAKVQLIDGKQFTTMLLEAGIVNLDKAI
ncbi:MAG: restriction endonuclease [Bacteroidales bacterium]